MTGSSVWSGFLAGSGPDSGPDPHRKHRHTVVFPPRSAYAKPVPEIKMPNHPVSRKADSNLGYIATLARCNQLEQQERHGDGTYS
jgi:hypothetical protein